MNSNRTKLLSLLGMARRAGKLSTGFESVKESALKRKSRLIICSFDLSPKTFKELSFAADGKNCERSVLSMEEISNAVGTKTGCVSLNDQGFADAVKKLLITLKEDSE